MSNEWPVLQIWHLNEYQALTGSENEASELGTVPLGSSTRGITAFPTVLLRTAKEKLLGQPSYKTIKLPREPSASLHGAILLGRRGYLFLGYVPLHLIPSTELPNRLTFSYQKLPGAAD